MGCCPNSTYPSAERCIDGVTDNANGWNFCLNSFTKDQPFPWFTVQVPRGSNIGDVQLFPREDCCQEELFPYEIWVGDVPGAGGDPYRTGASRCGPRVSSASYLSVSCRGLRGS